MAVYNEETFDSSSDNDPIVLSVWVTASLKNQVQNVVEERTERYTKQKSWKVYLNHLITLALPQSVFYIVAVQKKLGNILVWF